MSKFKPKQHVNRLVNGGRRLSFSLKHISQFSLWWIPKSLPTCQRQMTYQTNIFEPSIQVRVLVAFWQIYLTFYPVVFSTFSFLSPIITITRLHSLILNAITDTNKTIHTILNMKTFVRFSHNKQRNSNQHKCTTFESSAIQPLQVLNSRESIKFWYRHYNLQSETLKCEISVFQISFIICKIIILNLDTRNFDSTRQVRR